MALPGLMNYALRLLGGEMGKYKPPICFVDDSDHELRRFRENLESRFMIGTGRTLDDALADLQKHGYEEPDLFVLDMYFPEGPPNTEQQLAELHAAWTNYRTAHAEFMSTLGRLGQTSAGGEGLADQIRKRYDCPKYVFLTRKATLEEGLRALRRGALDVIKKPDPNSSESQGKSLTEAEDEAFRNRSPEIAAELSEAIRKTTWWWKHHEAFWAALIAFLTGILANVLTQVGYHFVTSSK
jgi:CheY-like chemotaxis protein